MDEISRDPSPESTNDDPSSPLARRFQSPPLDETPLHQGFDLEGALDAPPPLGEPRFASAEYASEPAFDAVMDSDPELPDLPGVPDPAPEEDEEPVAAGSESPEALEEVPALADPKALARVVLAALLASRETLSVLRLAQVCNTTQKSVEEALVLVREALGQQGLPLELALVGGSARLLTTPDVFPYLQRLRAIKKAERLTPAAIETLAVIAYKQPVIRAEIEAIRGVKAGPMLRTLLDHKLVRVKGRRDVPGKPLEYETTPHFLERFNIQSLQDLPSLREFKAIEGS